MDLPRVVRRAEIWSLGELLDATEGEPAKQCNRLSAVRVQLVLRLINRDQPQAHSPKPSRPACPDVTTTHAAAAGSILNGVGAALIPSWDAVDLFAKPVLAAVLAKPIRDRSN